LVAAPGCARQLTRIETGVDTVQSEQKAQRKLLDDEVAELRSELARASEVDREKSAELNARLDALERLVTQLSAQWEEQQKLLRDLRSGLQIVDRSGPAGGSTTPSEPAPSPAAGSAPTDASGGTEIYDAAWADFTRGNYTLARQGFTELVDRFPSSELATDSRYWIAETYYSQANYQESFARFDQLLAAAPPAATQSKCLLKMGYCQLAMGDEPKAVEILRRLMAEFPKSDEALIAENRLSTLQR
jgi:tol-pal system protein YbgF